MKIIYFVYAFLFLFYTAQSQNFTCRIKGYLKNSSGKTIYLSNKGFGYTTGKTFPILDSTISIRDSFSLKGNFTSADFLSIEFKGEQGWQCFFTDTGTINLHGNGDSIYLTQVSGSVQYTMFSDFYHNYERAFISQRVSLNDSLDKSPTAPDSAITKYYLSKLQQNAAKFNEAMYSFVRNNPNSFYALLLVNKYFDKLNLDSVKTLYNLLTPYLQLSNVGKLVYGKAYLYNKLLANGMQAPDIKMKNIKGNNIHLKNFKQKYLLLDFWASWCQPCVSEFAYYPSLLHALDTTLFKVIYISIDDDQIAWKMASAKFHLPSTYNYLMDPTSKNIFISQLNIATIPRYLLIDKNGVIIDFNAPRPSEGDNLKIEINGFLKRELYN